MAIKFSQFNLRTDSTPTMFLVGYDGNQNIHITVDNLLDGFIDGTENTIAMFGEGGHKVIDSMVAQNAEATLLTVAGSLNVDADATFDTTITVTGDSTLNGNVVLGDESTDLITQTGTLYLNGPVKDTTDTLGEEDQILVSDASGELTFTDLADIAVGSAEVVEVPVKNLQGSALTKGDPVYISGSVGASGRLEVKLADASNAAKMPALGLLKQDLGINEEGFAVVTGKLRNLPTDPIDGQPSSANDVIYVKAGGTTGAALTLTKPTGSNLIQNMGKVGRASTSNDGTFVVSSILRTNDIPNLTPGKIWVGSTGNTIESSSITFTEATGAVQLNEYGTGTITGTPAYNLSVDASGNVIETAAVPANIVETLTAASGTYISLTDATDATGSVDLGTFDLNAEDGVAIENERYLTKSNTWAEISTIPGTYTFDVTADGGTDQTILSGETLDIAGGTYITTSVGDTDTVTINHDDTTRTDTTSAQSPGYGGTFTAVDSISTNTQGHLTAVNLKTVTMPSADNTNTTYNLEGVGGANGTAGVRLAGSDTTNDDVLIVGAGTTEVARANNTLTVTSNDQYTGTVTSVGTSAPLTGTITSTGTIGITQATTNTNGYLSSTDWNTFNSKQDAITNPVTGTGVATRVAFWDGTSSLSSNADLYWDNTNSRLGIGTAFPSSALDVAGRAVIGTGNTLTNATNATVIGNSNNLTSDSIVDANTNLVLGDYGAGRYGNTVISDRTLRLGRADVITATELNTTGILNFNDSVEANSAFSNVGGIVGYFPPPTATNDYHFISAFSENVNGSAFTAGASPTASRYQISTNPALNCIVQKFDGNTTNSGAVYIIASNNSSTPSSKGIFTFDARHQNQNSTVPNGHALFEVTSGYGQSKFIIKQVNGSSNVGIGTTSPGYKTDVVNTNSNQTTLDSLTFRARSENYAGTVAAFENNSGVNTSIRISDTIGNMYVVSRDGIMGLGASGGWSSSNLNIKSNGYVGIGNRNPSERLHVKNGNLRVDTGRINFYEGATNRGFIGPSDEAASGSLFEISSTYNIVFKVSTSQTEKMRLTYDGRLLLNAPDNASAANSRFEVIGNSSDSTTNLTFKNSGRIGLGSYNPDAKIHIVGTTGSTASNLLKIKNKSNAGSVIDFRNSTNIQAGKISMPTSTTVNYGTTSDYRLKTNVVSLEGGIEKVKKLKPSRFEWVDNNIEVDGFIAHEVAEIIPEAVTGVKDAIDENNNPIYQDLDYSKIVPVLTAALKEAIQKIESLESRVQILEN